MHRSTALTWWPRASALLAGGVALLAGAQPSDDAYITLRYARSIASGDGFVYNWGERVLGTTTPLFTLALATLHWIAAVDLVTLAVGAAVIAHMLVVLLIARLGARCDAPIAGAVAATLYALSPLAIHTVVEGMETSLFVGASLAALLPARDSPRIWQSVSASAAALLRPEGVWIAILQVVRAQTAQRRRAMTAIVVGAPLLAWGAFATWFFGSPLPQSMRAKWSYHENVPAGHAAEAFWYVVLAAPVSAPMIAIDPHPQPFGQAIAAALPVSLGTNRVVVFGAGVLVVGIMGRGAWLLWRRNRQLGWLLAFAVGYIAAYCVANPHVFPWYLVPPLPLLILCFVAGAELPSRGIGARRLNGAVAAVLIGVAITQAARFVGAGHPGRELAYRQAVDLIGAPAQDPNVSIGALEIGAIGYAARARIVDHYGLVTPPVIALGHDAAVRRFHPEYYIVQDIFLALSGLGNTAAFKEHYRLIASVPMGTTARVQVWRRSD